MVKFAEQMKNAGLLPNKKQAKGGQQRNSARSNRESEFATLAS